MTPELFVPLALLLLCIAFITGLPPALTMATVLIVFGSLDLLASLPARVQVGLGIMLLQVIGIVTLANWAGTVRRIYNRGPK